MASIIIEIEQSYDNKIAALEKEIERLKEKKLMIMSSLREDIGDIELNDKQVLNLREVRFADDSRDVSSKVNREINIVSAVKRINDALSNMSGDFSSTQLWESASKDGRGPEIPKTSFHPKFSQMLKDGLVVVVKKPAGGIAGIYRKPSSQNVESSEPVFQEKLL